MSRPRRHAVSAVSSSLAAGLGLAVCTAVCVISPVSPACAQVGATSAQAQAQALILTLAPAPAPAPTPAPTPTPTPTLASASALTPAPTLASGSGTGAGAGEGAGARAGAGPAPRATSAPSKTEPVRTTAPRLAAGPGPGPGRAANADLLARGEYLARAGDCIACHTAARGQALRRRSRNGDAVRHAVHAEHLVEPGIRHRPLERRRVLQDDAHRQVA